MLNRRYLCSFDSRRILHRFTDVAVIGAGAAGLRAACEIAARDSAAVTVIAKGPLQDANTSRAQGGVAAVLMPERTGDSTELHIQDTLASGCGLADKPIAEITIREGVDRVRELIDWGAEFDRKDGAIHFTQEGGHRKPRIAHARGDATGREVLNVLARRVAAQPSIQVCEGAYVLDLITENGRCTGLLTWRNHAGLVAIWARAVILASGGYGRLYRENTNGPHSTGDGAAVAYRAGAELKDLEFVQFHPTALYIAGAERFLITEAARGEGGVLKDAAGVRFMPSYHPMAELAPRDVVARAILDRMNKTSQPMVFLDLTGIGREKLATSFPGILAICRRFDIDPVREPIPVRPGAHYTIGGVAVDSWGRSTLPGLYACGEVAVTGLHGANRLGSNSLLEALVFGRRAALRAIEDIADAPEASRPPALRVATGFKHRDLDVLDMRRSLESLMAREVGIIRTGRQLADARRLLARWSDCVAEVEFGDPQGWELQNMLLVAQLIAESALWRRESRGAHYRNDFPSQDPAFAASLRLSRADGLSPPGASA
ncbi:MAG TPA: L-aspartate oxidase [Planctomycetota bacterium]|jgi:L-aspartate oxidase|nr:L-aspartate oxidase [Planctomycetota bacterium]OQC19479.1 MAG: L-aspartate oxidase [Planctomycetes bacterium ADurb.Bin069]HNR99695.1 L-aspartate oxidase [Planctomycetota bacterium]HNU25314.1 L-aspartate oxidase [Planctomycetota bacterium]HOE29417.1 L-aspartate oxidase [Planctomycetota bacterium]